MTTTTLRSGTDAVVRTARRAEQSAEELLAHTAGAGFEAVMANAALRGLGALVVPTGALRQLVGAMTREPDKVTRRLAGLASRLGRVVAGVDDDPGALDRRFGDRAWSTNPVLKRLALGYLGCCEAAEGMLSDADIDWRTKERLRLALVNLLAAAAPTNTPFSNPASWKEALDTGGDSVRAGLANLVADLRSPTKLPAAADTSAFEVGETIAATKGKVVSRTRLYELIQYEPRVDRVDTVPVLVIASPVNKYYLLDLEPEQSVAKAELEAGRQMFVVSWVNPDASHADVGFDDYVGAIIEMLETVAQITGSESTHLLGLCGGGVLAFVTAAYLATVGREHLLATLTIGIAVIDYTHGPSAVSFLDPQRAERTIARGTARGYFDARDSARSFALMRPIDGVWNSAVNNYLLGRRPPAMGLLYWAADQTNLTATYGSQMVRAVAGNWLARPGAMEVFGEPIDAAKISVDTYVLGASTDHISPWQDCFRTVALVGGSTTFVLAKGGHAVVIAKGPGSPRTSYRTGEVTDPDAETWLDTATNQSGSWWDHWNEWIEARTPDTKAAPVTLGSDVHPAVGDAPGTYVRRRVT